MSIYLHSEIRVRQGHIDQMLALLKDEIKPAMEAHGWRLLGCWQGLTGPVNTLFDVWEIDDLELFRRAYLGLGAPSDTRTKIDAWVESETLTIVERRI